MKKILVRSGLIVGHDEVRSADLLIEDGIIRQIGRSIEEDAATYVIDASGKFVLPGFIDIHNHGSAGFDVSFGKYDQRAEAFDDSEFAYTEGLNDALKFYLNMGVTKVLLTTMTAPLDRLNDSLRLVKNFLHEHPAYRSLIYGINLEGTFLKDPAYAGAQNPKYFYDVDEKIIDSLQASSGGLLKIVNVPPEHGEDGRTLIARLADRGIVVAGGHSGSFGDEFALAIKAGLKLGVHFLNGPSRNSSKYFRMGGAVEMMLRADEVFLEIICDGYHVDPSYVRDVIARKGYQRVIMITDAMFANGMPDLEQFELLGLKGLVSKDRKYLQVLNSENTLFGSILRSDLGFGNVVSWLTQDIVGTWHRIHKALSLGEALIRTSRMFSANPAKLLGIYDTTKERPGTGSIGVGKSADLIIVRIGSNLESVGQRELCITHTILQGIVYQNRIFA